MRIFTSWYWMEGQMDKWLDSHSDYSADSSDMQYCGLYYILKYLRHRYKDCPNKSWTYIIK